MPSRKRTVHFLRLVEAIPEPAPLKHEDLARPALQDTLFADQHPALLIFINFEIVTEADFLTVLAARPRYVLDLRRVPRFDVGGLNRKLVFSIFGQSNVQYIDLSGGIGAKGEREPQLAAGSLAGYLRNALLLSNRNLGRPIAFLVDHREFQETYITDLASELPSPDDNGWDVLTVPQTRVTRNSTPLPLKSRRDVIFISHANPEDNAFALWLATHLACAGYSVWSDLTKLLGGEAFWDTIEDGIRYQCAKVIVALSRKAQLKQGMLDEINLAVSVERAEGLSGFVVPIRIDDLPFADVRANLARKNIVDFRGNWATGLAQILKAFERDGVPKVNVRGAASIADWCRSHLRSQSKIERRPEPLVANWLTIRTLPESVVFHQINVPLERIDDTIRKLDYPYFRYLRLIGAFAEATDFQSDLSPTISLTERYRVPLKRFLLGRPVEVPDLGGRETRNFAANLVRQAWDREARIRGLKPYEIASGAIAWYLPKALIDDDRVVFIDDSGRRRRKLLVGRSERRQVYWHFGIEAKPVLGRIARVVLRPHVIFSSDGLSPVASKERMHVLRRSFCRNWWNDRWRDLILAFVSWFAAGHESISLPVGSSTRIDLSRSLFDLEAPVSLLGEATNLDIADEFSNELDEAEVLDDDPAELDDEWPSDANPDGDKVEGESE